MRVFSLVAAALFAFLLAGPAFAQDEAGPLHPPPPGWNTNVTDVLGEKPYPTLADRRHWVALTLNPVATLAGRWGGNVEVMPWRHHGFVFSGSYVARPDCCSVEAGMTPSNAPTVRGAFGELGYRYYTSSHDPAGLFIGPSLIVGGVVAGNEPVSLVGAAVDVGGQVVFHGFVFGGGIGAQVLRASHAVAKMDDPLVDVLTQSMVSPRVLATVGYAL